MAKLPMSPTPDESEAPDEIPNARRPTAAIRDGILAALGRPPGLYRVVVVSLWLNYYRVNVLVGSDPATVAMPHSYFVEADQNGLLLTSVPPLLRVYQ